MMRTLDLKEAAEFLKMKPASLRQKAARKEIPGRKAGKRWVFVEEHLADWISGTYAQKGQMPREEEDSWQSTSETKGRVSTGSGSRLRESAYMKAVDTRTK